MKISKSTDFAEGQVLLLDKPLDWTSFQLVKKVRYLVKVKKVGHAGTLDPLATGLLIICTGKFTKIIQGIQDAEKEYTGTFTIGATRPSYDKETEINEEFDITSITEEQILETAKEFIGVVEQVPPIFSAIKVKGKRAYEYARKGEDIKLKPRNVTIREFEITKIALPEISFRVACSKGTYIRTLADDFGKALNNGAYLSSLRRTKIGEYSIDNSIQIDEFEKLLKES